MPHMLGAEKRITPTEADIPSKPHTKESQTLSLIEASRQCANCDERAMAEAYCKQLLEQDALCLAVHYLI